MTDSTATHSRNAPRWIRSTTPSHSVGSPAATWGTEPGQRAEVHDSRQGEQE